MTLWPLLGYGAIGDVFCSEIDEGFEIKKSQNTAWISIRQASEIFETKLYTINPTNHLWYSHERGRVPGVAY